MTPKLELHEQEKLKEIIQKYKQEEGALIPILQQAQDLYGYLPLEVQQVIAEGLDIPLTKVYGVATFYSQFTLEPKGEYKIGVCLGTACYVRGAQEIMDRLCKELDIKAGETTKDGKFSIEATRCIGACGLAPVISINDEVYGRLVEDDIPDILKRY